MSEITGWRRYYWSLRRELWEYPSIWIVPIAAAAVALIGFLVSIGMAAGKSAQLLASQPFDMQIGLIMVAGQIVAVFYSLDALYGERRDRSILFWKSLPVSDATTVLSKLSIPLLIVPLITALVTIPTLAVTMLLSRTHPPLVRTSILLVYHMFTVHALWWAPLFGWLLFVSAWARRAPFVWATVPLVALSLAERIAFNTMHIRGVLNSHFTVSPEAIVAHGKLPTDPMTHMTPGPFLSSWGLWLGLAITAGFVVAAIRLRRNRGPI